MATWGCQDPVWARGRCPTAEEEEAEEKDGKLAQTSDERQVRVRVTLSQVKRISAELFNDRIYPGFQCRLQSNKWLTTGEVQIKHKHNNVDFVTVKLCECEVFVHQAKRQKLEPWAAWLSLCLRTVASYFSRWPKSPSSPSSMLSHWYRHASEERQSEVRGHLLKGRRGRWLYKRTWGRRQGTC